MESIAALSLAMNIVQAVDFTSRIISRGYELYESADGRIEEHAILASAAENLSVVYEDIRLPEEFSKSSSNSRNLKQRMEQIKKSDMKLLELREESDRLVKKLQLLLNEARVKGPHRKWKSVYQALCSVSTDKAISVLADRLENIRNQVNTAILVSLRETVGTIAQPPTGKIDVLLAQNHNTAEQRHAELLNAVRMNNWDETSKSDVSAFSARLESYTTTALETRFKDLILSRLYFPHMPNRADNIPLAHSQTFQWLFQEDLRNDGSEHSTEFTKWLQEDDNNIYWITGKPGSGKSTLMKYIYHHTQLDHLLESWTQGRPLVQAGYYLWNSGSVMQMSRVGLLQALIHASLSADSTRIVSVFAERWKQYLAFGGGQEPFDWPELLRTFKRIIADQSTRYFFLIDGLDEYEGEPRDMIEFILDTVRPNVKFCIASRPWLPFEDAFKQRPSLRLERLTEPDILKYVSDHFEKSEHYIRLRNHESEAAEALVSQVVDKAVGVFLWVYLVVRSLLEGFSNADSMSVLKTRLDALPSDLEALFDVILNRLHPDYFKQACELFRLMQSYRTAPRYITKPDLSGDNPTLLGLYLADAADIKCALSYETALERAEDMRRRLNARCKGLLEIHVPSEASQHSKVTYDYKVSYLHRTARDYVESMACWQLVMEQTGGPSYQPQERWFRANLWLYKYHPLIDNSYTHSMFMENCCLDSAVAMHAKTGRLQATYLNDVFHHRRLLQPSENRDIYLNSLDAWSHRLGFHDSLVMSLVVLVTIAEKDDHAILMSLLQSLSNYSHSKTTSKAIRRTLDYYTTPEHLRWLRRRPNLPLYE